jgi:hypothetical protein
MTRGGWRVPRGVDTSAPSPSSPPPCQPAPASAPSPARAGRGGGAAREVVGGGGGRRKVGADGGRTGARRDGGRGVPPPPSVKHGGQANPRSTAPRSASASRLQHPSLSEPSISFS